MTRKSQKPKLPEEPQELEVRLDKWLHASRFYKTRSLATQMIEGGKVSYKGKRVKPSQNVEIGAEITLQVGSEKKTIIVEALSNTRTAYKIAKYNYQETEASIARREALAEEKRLLRKSYTPPVSKPNKKQRRTIAKYKLDLNNLGSE